MPSRAATLPLVEMARDDDFALIRNGIPATVCVDAEANPAVRRVARDLRGDMDRVAGASGAAVQDVRTATGEVVLVGVVGESSAIDRLVRSGQLHVESVTGQWEGAVVATVVEPWPGVHKALVVAGSDRRGAIYGAYWISEALGVSPWYWWADVPVPHREFAALIGGTYELPSPKVRYRGIFLNDEDWTLRPWAAQTHEPKTGNIGPKTYERIFELLLRLRGNLLWPAMHPGTRNFNFYSENKTLADEYGIIMGSSHAEPMLRDNVDEWERDGTGEYNYLTNRSAVLKYWEDRVRTNGSFENVYTVGMRGIHDSSMEGGGTMAERAERLRRIITDQRELLRKGVAPDVTKIPQMFCPYKEVLEVYEADPTLVPDDVTLVWPDDNYGYIQHLSTPAEQSRSGGAGVYYHISYWGAPYDYLWLPSTPPALIGEEMTKAWRHGASRIWVVNVGGLKPREWQTEFFLRTAWSPDAWVSATGQRDYLRAKAERDFGERFAEPIADVLMEYYRLNAQRRPEHMGLDAGSPWLRQPVFAVGSDEARERAAAFIALRRQVEAIGAEIDTAHQPAFFELVAYPVHGAALMNLKWMSLERAQEAKEKEEADRCYGAAKGAQAEIDQLPATYDALLDGKWRHMASIRPREQAVFDLPLPASAASARSLQPETIWASMARATRTNQKEQDFVFCERDKIVSIAAVHVANFSQGQPYPWLVQGLGYNGAVIAVRSTTATTRSSAEPMMRCEYPIQIATPGQWQIRVRVLPTWPQVARHPSQLSVAVDDGKPLLIEQPTYHNEKDPRWQEDVLRNASILTTSVDLSAGRHILRIDAVTAGVMLDSILLVGPGAPFPGYEWPDETVVGQ